MIKVQINTATRVPIPAFLRGLRPESLLDLSWTDPALGVQDCAWWPEDDQSPALGEYERYGAETLTPDHDRQIVVVSRAVEPWTEAEIAEHQAQRRAEAVQRIAGRRWQAETGGTVVDGMQLETTRDSQALITGAAVSAMLDSAYTARWKTRSGFVDLRANEIIAVASAVRAHVQACFDREAELLSALDDGSFTPEMIEEGWPNESAPGDG